MTFGNAHVKHTLRHRVHHDVHRTARRHRWRHTHNLLVLLCQLQERLAKHLLKLRRTRCAVITLDALTRVRIELAWRMPDGRILLSRCIAITLRRMDVEQLRTLHFLDHLQDSHQLYHIVSLGRTEVTDVHSLEDILLTRQDRLQAVIETNQFPTTFLVQDAPAKQLLRQLISDVIISSVGGQLQEILPHATHTTVNRHIVIVQHNQHVVRRACRVVDALERQSATHRTVTNHSHNLPVLTLHLRRHSHTQRCRNGIAGMSATERVILALVRMRERLQTIQFAVRAELVTTPRQNLMSVCLVPHVPHNAVVRRVEHIMQRHRQLHHTQARSQMTRIHRQLLNDVTPQFIAHGRQFLHLQLAQVNRIINLR